MSDLATSPTTERCQNCEAPLHGDYCAHCGQRALDFHRDWKGLAGEILSSFFNLDGKVAHGLYDLLFRPGLLSRQFLSGHRASQIPPIRFYLFVSVLFFLWIGISPESDSAVQFGTGFEDGALSADAEEELAQAPEWLSSRLGKVDEIRDGFYRWLPRAFLLGIPVLALCTRLLFWKRGFVYLEHLLIALHLQTFAMIWMMFCDGWSQLAGLILPESEDVVFFILSMWMVVFPVPAFRRIFGLSWKRAVFSSLLIEAAYFTYIIMAIAAVGAVAFFSV